MFAKIVFEAVIILWLLKSVYADFNFYKNQKNQFINTYSNEYLKNVFAAINPLNKIGGYYSHFRTLKDGEGYGHLDIYTTQYGNRTYLASMWNNANLVHLNIHDMKFSGDEKVRMFEENCIRVSFFERFIKTQKQEKTFENLSWSRWDFIKKYKLQFLFAEKNAIIDSIVLKNVNQIITDNKSGEKLLILQHE